MYNEIKLGEKHISMDICTQGVYTLIVTFLHSFMLDFSFMWKEIGPFSMNYIHNLFTLLSLLNIWRKGNMTAFLLISDLKYWFKHLYLLKSQPYTFYKLLNVLKKEKRIFCMLYWIWFHIKVDVGTHLTVRSFTPLSGLHMLWVAWFVLGSCDFVMLSEAKSNVLLETNANDMLHMDVKGITYK